MQPIVNLQNGDGFPLENGLPPGYRGIILQGAEAVSGQSSLGRVVLQHFQRADFSIQFGIYKFLHLVQCALRRPPFPTGSLLALKSNLKSTMNGTGSLSLRQGQFSFLQYGGQDIHAEFKANKEYQVFEISWSGDLLSQALANFSEMAERFKPGVPDTGPSIISSRRFAGDKARALIHDILHSNFDPELTEEYFGYRIREYLLLLLVESSKKEKQRIPLTKGEKQIIRKLTERLKQDPRGKFPIALLAREMGMNEMKLKMAFQQEVGKPISRFHMEQRMKEAHRLLKIDGYPAKMVAQMVGYSYVTNFISHFREYFGYPPSTIQKKL
jgi:AraC-like DNA-binding protein